jgi:predicted DCC family thiol-disulfide oxidoreductase YuxK
MNQDVVLYDGECNFCIRQIEHLRRLDGKNRLRFVSLHDPQVMLDYPDLSRQELMDQMWVVDSKGGRHGGAAALRYLSLVLPLLWPLAPLLHLPGTMPIWSWLYRQVANRRYRIAGRNCDEGTCSLHGKR